MKELFRVKGVDERVQRMEGINLSGGATNAVEFCEMMLGMPSLEKMLASFQKTLNPGHQVG